MNLMHKMAAMKLTQILALTTRAMSRPNGKTLVGSFLSPWSLGWPRVPFAKACNARCLVREGELHTHNISLA